MTEDREFYASTVDEAVAKAAADLGVDANEVSFKVLDEGNTGFLGIGARDARIVVQGQHFQQDDAEEEHAAPAAAPPSSEELEESESTPPPQEAMYAPAPLGSSTPGDVSSAEEQVAAPEDLLDDVRRLISSVLTAMDFQAGIDVYDAEGFIAADVTPDNTALFIGQKGETIDALQYLVNVAVYKERPFVKRIVLDAEGYRQRRVEALQGMAHRTARRAVREHRAVELPPMNSSERRVVHLFLQDNPGVTTQSEGSGDNRRVKVLPV
jgi:spoIIIJ-associated protein